MLFSHALIMKFFSGLQHYLVINHPKTERFCSGIRKTYEDSQRFMHLAVEKHAIKP